MATLNTSAVDAKPIKASSGVHMAMAFGSYTTVSGTTLADGDVINLVKVPKGARVVELKLSSGDCDSNGTPAVIFDVGDTDDADRYIDGSTVGQTGGSLNSNAYDPYHAYTADSYISVTVVTAPATQVNGASIAIAVTYTMDEIF